MPFEFLEHSSSEILARRKAMLAAVLLALVGSAEAYSSLSVVERGASRRSSSPVCLEASSRRQAVVGAGALLAAGMLPAAAFADSNDDAMAKIAVKNRAVLAKQKEEERARIMEMVEEASSATACDAAAMAEHRQGPLRPWVGRRSGRQATIGMDGADGALSEMKHK